MKRLKSDDVRPMLIRLQVEHSVHCREYAHITADLCVQKKRDGEQPIPESYGERSGLLGLKVSATLNARYPEWGVYGVKVCFGSQQMSCDVEAAVMDRMAKVIGAVVAKMQRQQDKHGPAAHIGWYVRRFAEAVGATGFCYQDTDADDGKPMWVFENELDGYPKIQDKVWQMAHQAMQRLKDEHKVTKEWGLLGCGS